MTMEHEGSWEKTWCGKRSALASGAGSAHGLPPGKLLLLSGSLEALLALCSPWAKPAESVSEGVSPGFTLKLKQNTLMLHGRAEGKQCTS